jgi:hypothetical protein
LVQTPSSTAANWLGDSFGVQQVLANNEDLAENLRLQHSDVAATLSPARRPVLLIHTNHSSQWVMILKNRYTLFQPREQSY